jgi:hypothetical protein
MATRRMIVRYVSGPALLAVRDVMACGVPDVVKVAALVEIAGAAATLARSMVKLRHLDPAGLYPYAADVVDVRAVLGRGRWLPTMVRHVLAPPDGLAPQWLAVPPARSARSARLPAAEPGLFPAPTPGSGVRR